MHISNILTGLYLSFPYAVSASPTHQVIRSCKDPPKREEWRQLPRAHKKSYIEAVLCLTTKPAISGITGAVHRYDDFVAVHNSQTPAIHWVGHFILWHRYFVATYEEVLRTECGYTGGNPYWDWSLDTDPQNPNSTRPFETEIFSPITGFGGNGVKVMPTAEENPLNITGGTGGGCVQDGPFVSSTFRLNFPGPSCLRRDFIPWIMNTFADPKLVQNVLQQPDYTSFARTLENIPSFASPNIHGSGHFGVGGVLGMMGSAPNSPGDPLFFLHHGNLDHVFWQWQQKDVKTRLNQVGGPVLPFDYNGTNVTLEFEVNIGKLAGNATLKELLDTKSGKLCYTYVED